MNTVHSPCVLFSITLLLHLATSFAPSSTNVCCPSLISAHLKFFSSRASWKDPENSSPNQLAFGEVDGWGAPNTGRTSHTFGKFPKHKQKTSSLVKFFSVVKSFDIMSSFLSFPSEVIFFLDTPWISLIRTWALGPNFRSSNFLHIFISFFIVLWYEPKIKDAALIQLLQIINRTE